MDLLPRLIWGKLKIKFLFKNKYTIGNESNLIAFYDLDKDGVPDQFVLQSLEEVTYNNEFGFIYDLNNDSTMDYIIYYGGNIISKDNQLYYYFYHWIDTNYDGDIDALAYNIVIYPNNSKPDPNKILWIMDIDKNGKPDFVDYVSTQNKKKRFLNSSRWNMEVQNSLWTTNN